MAAVPKTILRSLNIVEQAALAQIVRALSERMDRLRRATALLAVADGQSFAQAARQAGFRSARTIWASPNSMASKKLCSLLLPVPPRLLVVPVGPCNYLPTNSSR